MDRFICFAEYRIAAEHRDAYLAYTEMLLKGAAASMHIYEGTDQLNLFVEIWYANNEAEVEDMKKERCSERSSWYQIVEWIPGGADKMHVWTFKPAWPGLEKG